MAKTNRSRRRSRPLALGAFVLVAGAIGVLTWSALSDGSSEPTPAPSPTPSPEVSVLPIPQSPSEVGVPLAEAGCTPVEEPRLQRLRLTSTDEHPEYSSNPPTSGWYQGPPPPALYYVPIGPEPAVGAMAKGDVIVWHTGLTYDETQLLHGLFIYFKDEAITGASGEELGLEEPIVLTAWGKLQRCEKISGEAIATFFTTHRGKGPLTESA